MGPFELWDVQNGSVTKSVRDPLDYGIAKCDETSLRGGDAAFNAAALRNVMCGRGGGEKLRPLADAMMLTAGLGLEVTGRAATLAEGIAHAREALYTNAAPALVHRLELFGELHRAGIRADAAGGGACHA